MVDEVVEEPQAYQALAALDELAEVVQTARGVPMSAACVVPRGLVLDLIEDVRDSLPAELEDAQGVLDKRDDLLAQAEERLARALEQGELERDRLVGAAREQGSDLVHSAQEHAGRQVAAAQAQAERILATAHAEAETMVAAARQEAARLVESSEVHRAASAEAERLTGEARAQARQMAAEVEQYVDDRLESFTELLTRTMRQVDMGRQSLRERAGPREAGAVPAESTDPRRLG